MIEIRNVTKRFGRREALSGVSLSVQPGEVTLLLGANGAGKSTLLRCLLGITDFEGEIRIAGLDPLADGRAVRSLVGYMPQTGGLHPDLTVAQTMAFYAGIRMAPRERCARLLADAGLADHTDARVGDLSGGMRQRLGFALALLTDPQVLILDEPSASLDAASRQWLAGRLRAAAADGRTVLVSTHAGQELLDAGHHRVVLEDGRVVAGTAFSKAGCTAAATASAAPRGSVLPVIAKELSDAISSRWLIAYAVLLGALGLAATATGLGDSSGMALQAFGRTTATLMNLCLLLAPLVAVLMGAASIAGERERGTLEHLLAQPLGRTQLLLGKHLGLLAALTIATVAGFLPAGLLIVWSSGAAVLPHYLLFPAIASLAGAAMAGVGLLISVASRSAVQSQGSAVFAWFAFVLLYDLVLMGSLAVSGMPVAWLSASLAFNPIDAARVLGILALEPDLYLLGPAGAYLSAEMSNGGAAAILLAALVCWTIAPVAAAAFTFRVAGGRRRRQRGSTVPLNVAGTVAGTPGGPSGPMSSPKEVTLS
ncbi:MAG TPA: ATP-binding cassette domain-containing protein [Vicinamibacterales bacterium]|nr:ATP-binding cassette domain-containing protein [Vicinamibacterales bacterium]